MIRFRKHTFQGQKHIALIAHDNTKPILIKWCQDNREILSHHYLCGTGTTARMIAESTGLPVTGYRSGPLGGDQQIGSLIADGQIDLVIFLSDPLTAQPHDPDVKALQRISQVYDIPMACNLATADFLIHSTLFSAPFETESPDFPDMYDKIRALSGKNDADGNK